MDAPLVATDLGLYCPEGDFFVDPWSPVPRAVVTHAHADHACRGCGRYLTSREGGPALRLRMDPGAAIDTLGWGEPVELGGVRVSLHPAGHILGSAQVRVESRGRVVVVSGDYKVEPDPTCTPFEPVRCHVFLTESTFGLPIYRWPRQAEVFAEIDAWWRGNQEAGRASLLFGYALGKAQRLLAGVDPSIGPIAVHGAVEVLNRAYREAAITLPETRYAGSLPKGTDWSRHLIVAPPSAHGTPWARRFGPSSSAFASGWMRIRGTRRRRAVDRGFVVSDHADWPGLLSTIEATGAEEVWVTHGYSSVLVRHLREAGLDAKVLATRYVGEGSEAETEAEQSADDADGTGAEDQPLPP